MAGGSDPGDASSLSAGIGRIDGRVSQSVRSESTTAKPATMMATIAGQLVDRAAVITVVDDVGDVRGSDVVGVALPAPAASRVSSSTGAGCSGSGLAFEVTSIQGTSWPLSYCCKVRNTSWSVLSGSPWASTANSPNSPGPIEPPDQSTSDTTVVKVPSSVLIGFASRTDLVVAVQPGID